jgi:hypothetical protein
MAAAAARNGLPWPLALFGLAFGGFGLLFVGLFFPWRLGDDLRLASAAARTAPGTITDVRRTNVSINKTRVMEYAFRYQAEDGHEHTGLCYTSGPRWSQRAAVQVRYLPDDPDIACVAGARLSAGGWTGLVVLIFPLIGGSLVLWFIVDRRRRRRLLREGRLTEATIVSVEQTAAQANNRPIYRIVLTAPALNGDRPVKIARTNPAEVALARQRAADGQPVFVLYDPAKPGRLLLPEALIDPVTG